LHRLREPQARRTLLVGAILAASAIGIALDRPALADGIPEHWIDGTVAGEPQIQVERYDRDTYILRQSLRTSFEGPFLYLLFGKDKVLLLDSGAGQIPIRAKVDEIIATWLVAAGKPQIPLVVAHSHSHRDHVAGDDQFFDRPNTTVVGRSPDEVAAFFSIRSWPLDNGTYDLGGRILEVVPSPGHEPSHVMVFDRRTRLLLSGDSFYPGRLYFRRQDFDTYRSSIDRVVAFAESRDVEWILGAHIEMTDTAGQDFPFQSASHPHEHRLQLSYPQLLKLQKALRDMGNQPQRDAQPDFIINPLQ
jgi:glyoxylase-like metal-dependent hydrolase (beta-lactamase superfamily II)